MTDEQAASPGRRYDGSGRRAAAEETAQRILEAAADLARDLPDWDWSELTMTAVAEHAGVGRRTVYRHFESQGDLHAALVAHLLRKADVDYDGLRLDDLPAVATKVYQQLTTFAAKPWGLYPAIFPEVDAARRDGLRRAVADAMTSGAQDPEMVAALLDVIWQVTSYELLIRDWGFDEKRATQALRWLHGLVAGALTNDGIRGTLVPPIRPKSLGATRRKS
jgi:AcrR family transcriptional regulator